MHGWKSINCLLFLKIIHCFCSKQWKVFVNLPLLCISSLCMCLFVYWWIVCLLNEEWLNQHRAKRKKRTYTEQGRHIFSPSPSHSLKIECIINQNTLFIVMEKMKTANTVEERRSRRQGITGNNILSFVITANTTFSSILSFLDIIPCFSCFSCFSCFRWFTTPSTFWIRSGKWTRDKPPFFENEKSGFVRLGKGEQT